MLLRILLCIPGSPDLERVRAALARRSLVTLAEGAPQLWAAVRTDVVDLVILGTALLSEDPAGFVRALRAAPGAPDVILIGRSDGLERQACLAAGCLAVLEAGTDVERLGDALETIAARTSAERDRRVVTRPRLDRRLDALGTRSLAIRRFQDAARRLAASGSPVLIQGEPGSGKTWLGPVLHGESARSQGPFQSLRCSDSPEETLDSALFGHAAEALAGPPTAGRGVMERAHGGTLFLERIERAPLRLQAKLLEVLDTGECQRVGGRHRFHVDVRILASVADAPESHVERGDLHPGLHRRLGLAQLTTPPLRDRPEDVPDLALAAHRKCRARYGLAVDGFTPSALDALQQHTWPGNVCELWSVVERSTLLSRGDRIGLEDLPPDLLARPLPPPDGGFLVLEAPWLHDPAHLPTLRSLRSQTLEVVERAYLARVLRAAGGRVAEAARRADVDPRSLYERMRRYGLRKEEFKPPRRPPRRRPDS